MTQNEKQIQFNTESTKLVNTKELFGIECNFEVYGFKNKNSHVPKIDKSYKFDPETTLSILFNSNKLKQFSRRSFLSDMKLPFVRYNDLHLTLFDKKLELSKFKL